MEKVTPKEQQLQYDPFVSIKIKKSTYNELLKMQSLMQLELDGEKRVSFDEIIMSFINQQPKVRIQVDESSKNHNT